MTASEKPNSLKPLAYFLKTTWELYRSHVSLFLGYSAWMLVPMILTVLISATFGSRYTDITQPILFVIDLLVMVWVIVCIIQITPAVVAKKRIDTQLMSAQAWKLSISFLLLGLLISLVTIVGFIILIIPGILFAIYATFCSQILVLEKTTIMGAIKQSFALVKGRFWSVAHRIILANIIWFLPYTVAMFLVIGILLIVNQGNIDLLLSGPTTLMEQVFTRAVDVLFLPIFLILSVLIYQDAKATRS